MIYYFTHMLKTSYFTVSFLLQFVILHSKLFIMTSLLLHRKFFCSVKTCGSAVFFGIILVGTLFANLFVINVYGQNFPNGFNQVLVANGIAKPTVMAFAPDGRLFVAQQTGELRIIKNGVLLPQPFISLSVSSAGERGLLGIAFDPAFATNNFIYLYYTLPTGTNNRISRFTANGDVVVPEVNRSYLH